MKNNPFLSVFLLFLFVLITVSCNEGLIREDRMQEEEDLINDLLLDRGTTPITAEQAINVVQLYDIQNGLPATKSSEIEISDVYAHVNAEGTTVFYAVNRKDEKGFVIVSASRKYYPILAIANKGRFDENYEKLGLSLWVNGQSAMISEVESGESNIDCESLWSSYEKGVHLQFIATKTEAEAFALRQASVAAWEAQGYTCYELQECPNNLPSNIYNQWCTLAAGAANPDYNYMTYSVILEKRIEQETTRGPLIDSSWDQMNGFNAALPNANTCPIGCVPVAIGQIMWYHEKPSSFFWANMPASYATTATASFLYTLGGIMGIDYPNNDPTASHGDGEDALNYYGYSTNFDVYDEDTILSNIASGKPVYLGGSVQGSQDGHAWVCEGTHIVNYYYEYELKVISDIEPLEYVNVTQPYATGNGTYKYLYHNLGFYGSGNGWYLGYVASNHGTFFPTCMICDITPPAN